MEEKDIFEQIDSFKPNLWQKIWWPTMRFLKNIGDTPDNIKHWFQRANKGYDETYYWGVDYRIVKIVLPILKDLRKHRHGYPVSLNSVEEWDAILDKIILGWEAADRVCNDEYYLKTGFPEKRFEGDVEIWYNESLKDQKTFEEMMPLFTKYFFGLWD